MDGPATPSDREGLSPGNLQGEPQLLTNSSDSVRLVALAVGYETVARMRPVLWSGCTRSGLRTCLPHLDQVHGPVAAGGGHACMQANNLLVSSSADAACRSGGVQPQPGSVQQQCAQRLGSWP